MADVKAAFDEIVGDLDYPMFIVTVAAGEHQAGCLVGFATQTSIDPPHFLVCLSERNHTTKLAQEAELLGVHAVPADATGLAQLFGGETGDEVDKFPRVGWRPGPGGVPLLDEARNRFVGRIEEKLPAGDHIAFLLTPIEAEAEPGEREFQFHRAKRIDPGHEA